MQKAGRKDLTRPFFCGTLKLKYNLMEQKMEQKERWNIYYVSMGAPSLTMLLKQLDGNFGLNDIIEDDLPDEVVYVNLGFDWPEVTKTVQAVKELCQKYAIQFTELAYESFKEDMINKKITKYSRPLNWETNLMWRAYLLRLQKGRGWCGGKIRWGTQIKQSLIKKHTKLRESEHKEVYSFLGICSNEAHRISRPSFKDTKNFKYPLIEQQLSKEYCIQYVKQLGWPVSWLYEIGLTHIGCWCCRNHNIKEIVALRIKCPQIYEQLKELEKLIKEPYYRSPKGWALLDDVRWQTTKYQEVKEQIKEKIGEDNKDESGS